MTGMTVQDVNELIEVDYGWEQLRLEMGNGLVLRYSHAGSPHYIAIEGPTDDKTIGSLHVIEDSKVNWLFAAMGGVVNVLGIIE
jgi:hypothetical protein